MSALAALLSEAETALLQQDLGRAAMLYTRATELDEDGPLPLLGAARVALMVGRLGEALVLVERVLSRHAGLVQALMLRGSIEDAANDPAEARRWYERAVRADAGYGPARVNLGRVLATLQRWPEAVREFRKGLELSPSQVDAVPMFAVALIRAGQAAEAIRVLTHLLQSMPDHVDALVTLADALVENRQPALAGEVLANACERLPQSPVLFARRSSLALRLGNLPLARTAVDQQLRLTPDDAEACLFAATLALTALDFDDAERRVQAALKAAPYAWRPHYLLGVIYEALRLRTPAMVAYRTAIAYGADQWEPRNNLAVLLLELKTESAAKEARALLERALMLKPAKDALDLRFNLALAFWQLGDRLAAERTARAVAQSGSALPVVAEARRFLLTFSSQSRT
jgi:tetratricopeptide (TPR) repeat protein